MDAWACHLKDGSQLGAAFAARLAGGWHDCGDHGKYSETIAYTALMLSLGYAIWPRIDWQKSRKAGLRFRIAGTRAQA